MKQNQIPNTDLKVSEISLGTMTFGTPVSESNAISLTNYAIDNGINFIDTANMYEGYARSAGSSGGVAEEILGKALKGKRKQVVLATKLGMKVGDAQEDEGTSASAIKKHLELSLKRLNTDYIDLYYLHKPDLESVLESTLAELRNAISEGKIRHYGISNYSADQLKELLQVSDKNNLPRPVICQPPLSLLKQDILTDLIPLCVKEKIAICPYQILQGGLLTGKYRRGIKLPAGSRKSEQSNWVWELSDDLFEKLEEITLHARNKNVTMTQYAIQWILQQTGIVSAIVGVKNRKQIDMAVDSVSSLQHKRSQSFIAMT
jgi:1-deoxyxylulose-5-phosphate synthase